MSWPRVRKSRILVSMRSEPNIKLGKTRKDNVEEVEKWLKDRHTWNLYIKQWRKKFG